MSFKSIPPPLVQGDRGNPYLSPPPFFFFFPPEEEFPVVIDYVLWRSPGDFKRKDKTEGSPSGSPKNGDFDGVPHPSLSRNPCGKGISVLARNSLETLS